MSRAITWTNAMDTALLAMRRDGRTCSEIAEAMGMSKNAVINRCDRLGLVTGYRFRRSHSLPPVEEREETPLPAGHPTSWGAIATTLWPGIALLQARC